MERNDCAIYTSYFARIKALPKSITPIAIPLFVPRGYNGLIYPELSPTNFILNEYKKTGNQRVYVYRYWNEVLMKLKCDEVVAELYSMVTTKDICLICYEKSGFFCHRNIDAYWFRHYGYPCEEWCEF